VRRNIAKMAASDRFSGTPDTAVAVTFTENLGGKMTADQDEYSWR